MIWAPLLPENVEVALHENVPIMTRLLVNTDYLHGQTTAPKPPPEPDPYAAYHEGGCD